MKGCLSWLQSVCVSREHARPRLFCLFVVVGLNNFITQFLLNFTYVIGQNGSNSRCCFPGGGSTFNPVMYFMRPHSKSLQFWGLACTSSLKWLTTKHVDLPHLHWQVNMWHTVHLFPLVSVLWLDFNVACKTHIIAWITLNLTYDFNLRSKFNFNYLVPWHFTSSIGDGLDALKIIHIS